MDFASPLVELVKMLWGSASKHLGYIYNLKENAYSLENASKNLKAMSKDVEATVEREKEEGAQGKEQVVNWLNRVQQFVGRVDPVLREAGEHHRIRGLGRCLPPNCWSSYKLGKRVDKMLIEVSKLKEGEFNVVTSPSSAPRVLNMPMDKTVGLDISELNEVCKWLVDEKQVGVIGLYGTGGVGKTTLMKRINDELSHANHGFDIVIWIEVSRQVDADSIQDAIRKRLHIEDKSWKRWSQDERVHRLYKVLTRKKFVLLMDDVWGWLDLPKIGVPSPGLENGSKVVFTTRSKQVCKQMAADKTFEVQCLTSKEALELFEHTVGKSTVYSHREIPELAKAIVQECKGLPLVLITVGRAMASRENPYEWKHALTTLKNNPHELSGMKEVYHKLELSYNSLNDPTVQFCFLYCCLFPEDYHITPHNLIELWIGEGLIKGKDDVYSKRDEGEYVLGSLKMACLLESGHDSNGPYVKMHGVIRDMATWIACDHGQRESRLLVIENEEDISTEMISKWGEAEKVSLWGRRIGNIDRTPSVCSQLKTLFVRETNVMLVPKGFFYSMAASLTVLDMSGNNNIKSLPEGICKLISLRYLNLSATGIHDLPREINNLTHLQWLLLDDTTELLIPTGAVTSLPLKVFSQWKTKGLFELSRDNAFVSWTIHYNPFFPWTSKRSQVKEKEILEELGNMQHLTDLSISVFNSSSALKIFQSPNLQRGIRRVWITDHQKDLTRIEISLSPKDEGVFSHLEELFLQSCTVLKEMEIPQKIGQVLNRSCFPSLVKVWIERCGLLHLSWLVHTPKLRNLTVIDCNSMERIICDGFAGEESASGLFSCLETLKIVNLPILTSICDQTLPFPWLEELYIGKCPRLKKLPLDSNNMQGSLQTVYADADWWAKLEWDDDAARAIFAAKLLQDVKQLIPL